MNIRQPFRIIYEDDDKKCHHVYQYHTDWQQAKEAGDRLSAAEGGDWANAYSCTDMARVALEEGRDPLQMTYPELETLFLFTPTKA